MTTAIVWIGLVILAAVIRAEFVAWSKPAQRWLLRRAAAPQGRHADRYYEEWLAELEEIPDGPATRSFWTLRLFLKRWELASALGVPRPSRTASAFKRLRDIVVAGLLLTLLAPLLAAIGIAIRVNSPGPILSRYQLVDIDTGRKITVLRFRTRYADAEARNAALLTELFAAGGNEDDWSRVMKGLDALRDEVTPVGQVLRRTDLHQIPSLINVLRGEL